MSDEKKIPKKKSLKAIMKQVAPLVAILGIGAVDIYLCIVASLFIMYLDIWLSVLFINLLVIYYIYLSKDDLRSPIAKRKLHAIKRVKLVTKIAYIVTAFAIFGGGLLLVAYFIYLRAVASGITNIPAPISSQEAAITLLLLVSLPLQAYFVRREAIKAIRLGMLS